MASADILGIGMMTAVGVGAAQTAASVRAGVARLSETRVHNRQLQPIVMGTLHDDDLPPLDHSLDALPLTTRQARMLCLAGAALREAVADVGSVTDVPLLLATPEVAPGQPEPADPAFLGHLAKQSGVAFRHDGSRVFPTGRAGAFLALAEGLELTRSGGARRVLVGGVDSYLDLRLLAALDAEGRVLAEGVMDGFVPGEGAAFLLLAPPRGAGGRPIAHIAAVATGIEQGHLYSQEPYRGDGLATTFQALFAAEGAGEGPVQCVLAGFNGESFGAKEWGTAFLRSREHFADDMDLRHPVDCFGDAGAALGALLVALGAIGIQKGHLREPCLAWASSDRGQRGAALVRGRAE